MEQIDVDLKFNGDGEPTFFVSEDGAFMWSVDMVETADWRNVEGQVEGAVRLTKRDPTDTIVTLFDGSDTVIYALKGEAVKS